MVFVVSELESYISPTTDEILIETTCSSDETVLSSPEEWGLCGTEDSRGKLLKQSTFVLLPAKSSSPGLGVRLYEALKNAAIPIVIGDAPLPYEEVQLNLYIPEDNHSPNDHITQRS